MSSENPAFFLPPASTLRLLDDYVDEDEPEDQSSTQDSAINLSILTDSQQLPTPGAPTLGSPIQFHGQTIDLTGEDGNSHEAHPDRHEDSENDDDALAIFSRGSKRPKRRMPFFAGDGYTMQRGVPHYLRNDYQPATSNPLATGANPDHRFMGTESDRNWVPRASPWAMSAGERLSVNCFMNAKQRKRIQQLEKINTALGEVQQYLDESPDDVKILAKQLHLEALGDRLMSDESAVLNPAESKIPYETRRMLDARRINSETVAFETQARIQVEQHQAETSSTASSSSNLGKRKRSFPSKQENSWNSRQSSFSPRPTLGGKTISSSFATDTSYEELPYLQETDLDLQQSSFSPLTRPTLGGKTISSTFTTDTSYEEAPYAQENNMDSGQSLPPLTRPTLGGKTISSSFATSTSYEEVPRLEDQVVDDEEEEEEEEEESEDDEDENENDTGDQLAALAELAEDDATVENPPVRMTHACKTVPQNESVTMTTTASSCGEQGESNKTEDADNQSGDTGGDELVQEEKGDGENADKTAEDTGDASSSQDESEEE